jgi:excisionase family DNA binding protein
MERPILARETVRVDEAAQILGISRSTAYEAVRRGELPVIRIGRRLVVPRAALERMLGQAVESAAPLP